MLLILTLGVTSINLANLSVTAPATDWRPAILQATTLFQELLFLITLASLLVSFPVKLKERIVIMSLDSVAFQSSGQATTFTQTTRTRSLADPLSLALIPPKTQFWMGLVRRCIQLDLGIEGGSSAFYDVFVNSIRSLSDGASKRWVFLPIR